MYMVQAIVYGSNGTVYSTGNCIQDRQLYIVQAIVYVTLVTNIKSTGNCIQYRQLYMVQAIVYKHQLTI